MASSRQHSLRHAALEGSFCQLGELAGLWCLANFDAGFSDDLHLRLVPVQTAQTAYLLSFAETFSDDVPDGFTDGIPKARLLLLVRRLFGVLASGFGG